MNTTIKSLQDLYVKLGGELTDTYEGIADGAAVGDYTTIPDMIEAVKEKASSGGGGGGGSGGGNILNVELALDDPTQTQPENFVFTSELTNRDIWDALNAGKYVSFYFKKSDNDVAYYMFRDANEDGGHFIMRILTPTYGNNPFIQYRTKLEYSDLDDTIQLEYAQFD